MLRKVHVKLRNGKMKVGNLHISCTAFAETVDESEYRLTKALVTKKAKNSLRGEAQAPPRLRTTLELVVITINCIL